MKKYLFLFLCWLACASASVLAQAPFTDYDPNNPNDDPNTPTDDAPYGEDQIGGRQGVPVGDGLWICLGGVLIYGVYIKGKKKTIFQE